MLKIRFYNTSNSWWYFSVNYEKGHWLYFEFFGYELAFYWGKNAKYIP